MNKYIKSLRLRTLPLSVAGIVTGNGIAAQMQQFNPYVFLLTLSTTLCLQIVSNIANEIGDFYKGTDNNNRQGPQYALSQGLISVNELKNILLIFAITAIVSGCILIYTAFGTFLSWTSFVFILLGASALTAALKYTLGKKPYGYHRMGDLAVFLFFGLLSVLGSSFLQTKTCSYMQLLPASAIGLLSVCVLNINNMRDIQNDKLCGKHTVAEALGTKKATVYHAALWITAIILLCLYGYIISLCFLPFLIFHQIKIIKNTGKKLDKQLPFISILTLILSIICAIFPI